MFRYHSLPGKSTVAELTDELFTINDPHDALDLLADLGNNSCDRIIIKENNLSPDFFDLNTGLAGEILQKFSNYRVRLAVIGDFSKYKSKSLQDFIRECNRLQMILFTGSLDFALEKMGK